MHRKSLKLKVPIEADEGGRGLGRKEFIDREFTDSEGLLKIIPISRPTLERWRKKKLIPFIKSGDHRRDRVIFHIPTVRQALLRLQRSVAE
jgi:hypothetical protein